MSISSGARDGMETTTAFSMTAMDDVVEPKMVLAFTRNWETPASYRGVDAVCEEMLCKQLGCG